MLHLLGNHSDFSVSDFSVVLNIYDFKDIFRYLLSPDNKPEFSTNYLKLRCENAEIFFLIEEHPHVHL